MNSRAHEPGAPLQVLVIEDEPRFRELLGRLLAECECRAELVASAEAGLERSAHSAIDAVLLDLNLPGMDGMAFMRALRAAGNQTPVIILSAHGTLRSAQEAIRLGVVEFLTKPCHLGEIEGAIGRVRTARAIDLPERSWDEPDLDAGESHVEGVPAGTLAQLEREAILCALERHDGNKSAAAKELGISRRTLYNKLDTLDM